ncbi:hypothetical protein D3C87_88480 [compost metagenome]
MLNSSLDSTFVDRLKEILASRYGKGLQIRQLMDLNEMDADANLFRRGHDLHIPLKVNGAFLGTAVVPSADDLDEEKQTSIAQLVRMVLEPAMYRWYLEQRENNLQEINKANLTLDNVRLFGEEPLPDIDELLKSEEALEEYLDKSELISHLIHLEGVSENTNKKVALQLHEMTSRWAFVPFNDIKGQLHSSADISKLGEMTIFIERVEDLNDAEQELLLEYLEEERSPSEPLIVTSSRLKLSDLGRLETLKGHLMDEISVNNFEVDRAPLTSQGLKEVLELFFLKDEPFHS